jgi:phosphomannomutase
VTGALAGTKPQTAGFVSFGGWHRATVKAAAAVQAAEAVRERRYGAAYDPPVIPADLLARVQAWIADDPDPTDRDELRALLASSDQAELTDRFAARLTFGTAGLRGAIGGGPNRMNRAVVRAATAALAEWLHESLAGNTCELRASHAPAAVVVGCDARHRSADFAGEAARVLAGAGLTVHMLPQPCPTPLLAFAVRHLAAAAGVMITASHNPAADNGYKLYLSDGAQVIPPVDAEVEKRIANLGPLAQVPVADAGSPLITRHSDEVAQAYLNAIVVTAGAAQAGRPAGWPDLKVVYTAMHGVAGDLMLRAIAQAGFSEPHVVAAQAEPDPDFPTVAFPNPEEPGALDLALADARRLGAELVLASDPDGDRLAVALPEPSSVPEPQGGVPESQGRWRVLTGDQVGALLGASLLARTAGDGAGDGTEQARLVASTIVSSTLLAKIAAAAGARYAETLTGFKWISRAGDGVPGARFIFGYEEALGYEVGTVVRDKDGIGAALAMLWLAASAKAAGRTVLEEYDALETAHGVHLTSALTLRTAEPARIMTRLRAEPPAEFGGQQVSQVIDLASIDAPTQAGDRAETGRAVPRADVLIFRLAGARVVLRPSGTEPKTKCYIEIVEPLSGRSLAQARAAAAGRLTPLRSALQAVLADA